MAELRVALAQASTPSATPATLSQDPPSRDAVISSDPPTSIEKDTNLDTSSANNPPAPAPPQLDDLAAVLEYNQDNLENLKDQLARVNKVIPFVGAGMSAAYGFKGWWSYLMHHAREYDIAADMERLLTDKQYEEAGQALLTAMAPHAFQAALENEFGPRKMKMFVPNAVSQMIPKLTAGPVVTTNYDQVLERTFEAAGKPFYRVALGAQVGAAAKAVEQHRNILFKLHGDAEEQTARILTLADYQQHYGDVDKGGFNRDLPLPKVLARVMSATPLLFLGCSLEVDRTMKVLAAISQSFEHGGHYAILPLPKDLRQLPARKRQLSEHHISPIWYDMAKGHGMVEEILHHLVGTDGPPGGPMSNSPQPPVMPPPIVCNQPPAAISSDRLPHTSGEVFGRAPELDRMMAAWDDPEIRVLAFVAQGGEGKTALLQAFLRKLEDAGYRGAQRVFAWSFYSQGATTDSQASSAEFLRELLVWLGEREWLKDSHFTVDDMVGRIVELLRAERTLLILDGVEPLQHPPHAPHGGELKDRPLRRLLRELAQGQPGLCLVSTRLRVEDLTDLEGRGAVQEELPPLSPSAGAEVLHALGVKGRPIQLQDASEDLRGHALALTLLGTLLVRAYEADVQKRDLIPGLLTERRLGAHAQHILKDYVRWLDGLPALQVLWLMGLFDRPVELGVVKALAQPPAIAEITEHLVQLSEADWRGALSGLRELKLIGRKQASADPAKDSQPEMLDCHPLVREYFAGELQQGHKEAWTEAHRRLYVYYKDSAEEFPDTLEEMEPLFRAMWHGCKAGLYQEAFKEVYWRRIQRGVEGYAIHKLGAYSESLASIAGLFLRPWDQLVGELQGQASAFLLSEAGFCQRALGRLREAVEMMAAGLKIRIVQEDWYSAAATANNLSELRLVIGELGQAVADGRRAVGFADQSGDEFMRLYSRATLADGLHQMGQAIAAERLFREAEALQVKWLPANQYLSSVQGYWFCKLLLSKGEWKEVKERVQYALGISEREQQLLDIGLDQLSLGIAAHLQGLSENAKDFCEAQGWLDKAVEGLRKARNLDVLPLGLLARAALLRDRGAYPDAETDLQEVEEIARGGEMRLYLCDYHLEMARLCLAVGGRAGEAEGHYQDARRLVEETGYHRREGELAELRVALALG